MYLRGSKWSMNRRRKRFNWFRILLFSLLIVAGLYINELVLPTIESPFIPTATATRDPESYISEAETLFAQGKLLQAIEVYRQAIFANPSDPSIYVAIARVQVFAGQYPEAQTSAEDALLLNPNNSMAHAVRAWALDFQGELLAAEAAIKRALELDPNNALAHAYYAEILADQHLAGTGGLDALDRAAEESRVALSLAPNILETRRARGYILEVTANYEQAILEYQAAIALNGNIPDLHLALGRNYRALGVYDKAIEEFIRANSLNPSDPLPDLSISRTYASIGEYAKAVQFAEQAVQDDPADANLRGNLGVMYYRNFQWPEAAVQLGLAVRGGTSPEGPAITAIPLSNNIRIAEYYFTYGLVLTRLDRCGEALPIFQEILAKIPGNEVAVFNAEEGLSLCQQNLTNPVAPTASP